MSEPTCQTCPWWEPRARRDAVEILYVDAGSCRRKAPVAFQAPEWEVIDRSPRVHSDWPQTFSDDWCGEHPDRQSHLECATATLVTCETAPTELDIRRIVDALEKMAHCAAVKL